MWLEIISLAEDDDRRSGDVKRSAKQDRELGRGLSLGESKGERKRKGKRTLPFLTLQLQYSLRQRPRHWRIDGKKHGMGRKIRCARILSSFFPLFSFSSQPRYLNVIESAVVS